MKLAVPLLVGCAALLALQRHGWRTMHRWVAPALLVALPWLSLGYRTFFNAASSRLRQVELRADSLAGWVAAWWAGYAVYLQPQFYFVAGDGDPSHGVQNRGVQLWIEAPLVVLGLAALLWHCQSNPAAGGHDNTHAAHRAPNNGERASNGEQTLSYLDVPLVSVGHRAAGRSTQRAHPYEWWLVVGAQLIAPLPASLTIPNPYAYRAVTIAPIYALLLGLGVETIDWTVTRYMYQRWRRFAGGSALVLAAAALIWQARES